jgi:menaquinone-dependent protoporphyrinogen oxidase
MMEVLVSVASKYGATVEIADAIGAVLSERGFGATVIAPDKVEAIENYDAVVLGSAVYMGQWMKPMRELVNRSGEALSVLPVWLFSSGPVGEPLKPAENPVDVAEIVEATGARDHRVFAGKLVKQQLTFPERAMVAALRVQEGDFRDWRDIKRWAAGIADALQL